MNTQLLPVPFHNDTLVLVSKDGEPFVAMKSVVENMGLAWQVQHRKLTEKFGATITIMVTVGEDGKVREMVCLPLRKLAGWLYSINPNKVAPDLRDKIIAYQTECDDALWDYWTKGSASRPGKGASISQQLAAHGVRLRLLDAIERERQPEKRLAIQQQLEHASALLGLPSPAYGSIGREAPEAPPVLESFWEALNWLEANGEPINHAKSASLLALNMPQVMGLLEKHKLKVAPRMDLLSALRQSVAPKFERQTTVKSSILGKSVSCWVFEIVE